MAKSYSVWICGPFGKMGSTLCDAIAESGDISVAGVVSPEHVGTDCIIGDETFPTYESLEVLSQNSEKPDVIVDFTVAEACYENALFASGNHINFVTGTTGLSDSQKEDIEKSCVKNSTKAIIASNFSVGAVLMMHYAADAARHFDNAEIVEIHHTRKKDAPSGTAISTQKMMVESSHLSESDIPLHSLRLSGAVAHQHVYLSSPGEILRIEHDANDRHCFMPGILMSIREVNNVDGVIYSIESLLFSSKR